MTMASAFATRSERALVLSILRDDFGDMAERIAHELLASEGLQLLEIVRRVRARAAATGGVKPSLHEVIKHPIAVRVASWLMLIWLHAADRSSACCSSYCNTTC